MANSRKSPPNKATEVCHLDIIERLNQQIDSLIALHSAAPVRFVIGFSGGLDSAVLLHALVQLRQQKSITLQAVHVHHGLSPHADEWATFCADTCTAYQVPFTLKRVTLESQGLGVEAAAREARYAALRSIPADWLCLAHHQNDQAETLLLQLARGAGVKGLAAMPALDGERRLWRPLLNLPRHALVDYAQHHQLAWVEDESNVNIVYDRNWMRHDVLPLLEKRYPAIVQTLSRSAEHLAAASRLQADLARLDWERLHGTTCLRQLNVGAVQTLSAIRQANVLRWWLAERAGVNLSAKQLQQILQQMSATGSDNRLKIKLDDQQSLRRYQQCLMIVPDVTIDPRFQQTWNGEPEMHLPDGSRLKFTQTQGQGIAAQYVVAQQVTIRYRQGGERFQPQSNRPSRTLKSILQSVHMPIWQRERLPLLFVQEALIYVPNLGARYDLEAKPKDPSYAITWHDTGHDFDESDA